MSDEMITSLVIAVFASGGFWAFITAIFQAHAKKSSKEDAENEAMREMLRGLGHDRIVQLADYYIQRGYITPDEYENLNEYLFKPYEKLHGNGTAKKMMEEVRKLPSCPPTKAG